MDNEQSEREFQEFMDALMPEPAYRITPLGRAVLDELHRAVARGEETDLESIMLRVKRGECASSND